MISFCIFIFGCSSPCREWQLDRTISSCVQYNSCILFLPADTCKGLTLEFVRTFSDSRLYFNTMSAPFAPSLEDPIKSWVQVDIQEEESFFFLADRLEGGQRLWIPYEPAGRIISALLENREVWIYSGRNELYVTPLRFAEHFYGEDAPKIHSDIFK